MFDTSMQNFIELSAFQKMILSMFVLYCKRALASCRGGASRCCKKNAEPKLNIKLLQDMSRQASTAAPPRDI